MDKVRPNSKPETLDAPSTFGGRRPSSCSPLDDGLVMVRCWYCDAGCEMCDNTGYLRTDHETAGLPPLQRDTTKEELLRACDIIGAALKKENTQDQP